MIESIKTNNNFKVKKSKRNYDNDWMMEVREEKLMDFKQNLGFYSVNKEFWANCSFYKIQNGGYFWKNVFYIFLSLNHKILQKIMFAPI